MAPRSGPSRPHYVIIETKIKFVTYCRRPYGLCYAHPMRRSVTLVLQIVVVLLGAAVFAGLLWEPHLEGVNANATSLSEIYFDDPFLWYIYFSFIAVFVGLYEAFKLLGYIGRGEAYSQKSAGALRAIKYSALSFASLIFAAVAFLMLFNRGQDDIAGGVAVGLFLTLASILVGSVAGIFARKVRS